MSCFLSFLTNIERPDGYSCTRCCSQFCKSGKTRRKMRSQSTVLEEFCFTSKFLGLTSALFPWHASDMKEIKFLESAPCPSLNKMQRNLGTCFDVQNGWWHFPWQSRCIFDNLAISVSTCRGMWASRCSLSIWKKSLGFDMVKNPEFQISRVRKVHLLAASFSISNPELESIPRFLKCAI